MIILSFILLALVLVNFVITLRAKSKYRTLAKSIMFNYMNETNSPNPNLYKFYLANAGVLIGQVVNPNGFRAFASLHTAGIFISVITALLNLYFSNYYLVALSFVLFIFLWNSHLETWFPGRTEEQNITRMIFNYKIADPKNELFVSEDPFNFAGGILQGYYKQSMLLTIRFLNH